MNEINFVAVEAVKIHQYFTGLFYGLVLLFLTLSILIEYFRWPLGGVPQFGPLIGRVLIAAILLHIYPEISNVLSDLSESISKHLGDFNEFNTVLQKISRVTDTYKFSWASLKQHIILWVCYLAYFILYFTVHVAQAFHLYGLVLLYIFSPIIFAFFVLPGTAAATSALFRSVIEMSLWKPVWAVLATLLWSTGTSYLQADGSQVSFLSAICFCLIAAGSVVIAPFVVHMLASQGIHQMGKNLGAIGVGGLAYFTPGVITNSALKWGKRAYNTPIRAGEAVTKNRFPKLNEKLQNIPRFHMAKKTSSFSRPNK